MRSTRKMAIATFILVCAVLIVAAMTFQDNAWKHILQPEKDFTLDPPWLGRAVIAAGLASLLFFGLMGVGHAIINGQYAAFAEENEPPPPPEKTPAERRAEELANDGFHDHGFIEVPQPGGTALQVQLFAREPAPDQQNVINRDVTLRDAEGNESAFNYSVLFHDYSWKEGSERLFQGRHSRPIKIETALLNEYLRRGIEKAPRVVCFGLASSEAEALSEQDNAKLSDARGANLCKALFKIGYIKDGPQTAIAAGAGYAMQEGVADPALQRVAIVVGVQHTTRAFSVDAFVLAMNKLMAVNGVDLEGYSRQPRDFVTNEDVRPGPYVVIGEIEYGERSSDVIVPVIPKPAEPQNGD